MEEEKRTVLVMPITEFLEVVYGRDPVIENCEFSDVQLTIAPL